MKLRQLGRSGLKVSPLCLGTSIFGRYVEAPDAARIIDRARADGANLVDTADVYGGGAAEEIVGRAIKGARTSWVLATKVGSPVDSDPSHRGLSRRWIMQAVEASLRRLDTDYIDLYYFHTEDYETPLAESVRAVGDLVQQGKIRYFAVSNFRGWRVAEICRLCDDIGIDRPVASQPYYNAVNRMPEVEHIPACAYYGVGVIPYSPLGRGVLTGKYKVGQLPAGDTRAGRNDRRIMQAEWRSESLVVAQKIKERAEGLGISAGQFAVAWLLNNSLVTSAVAGPRTEEQWSDYVGALAYAFTPEDEAFMDGLVAPGHPSTPGFNDPDEPIEGRVPRSHARAPER
jgi:aryl-alcohol dehydrogenase (NADP+)